MKELFITQILCEINFEGSRNSKNAGFAFFGALNFINLVTFSLEKVKKLIKIKIHSFSMLKNGSF